MSNWATVYRDEREHRAIIVRDVLLDHNFDVMLVSKKDSAYGFGHFEVQVPRDDVILISKIIQEKIKFE